MPRFFSGTSPVGGVIELVGEDARHIAKSLRMQQGDTLTVCDGAGTDYCCRLVCVSAESVTAHVNESYPSAGEPSVAVSLYMALPKSDKMELVIQKATELGVFEVIPMLTERCISRPDEQTLGKKIARWQKIAEEAAKQSGRGRIPRVHRALPFKEALPCAAQADAPLLLYEAERQNGLKAALSTRTIRRASLLVGPEGGFAEEEVRAATAAGLISVSLGARILRCETAPLAALAATMYETNNL